jgi:hypothetical protein
MAVVDRGTELFPAAGWRDEAVRLAVRALRSLHDSPVLLSTDELTAHRDHPVYLLTRAEFSSAAEQMQVLESGRDGWAIDFRLWIRP